MLSFRTFKVTLNRYTRFYYYLDFHIRDYSSPPSPRKLQFCNYMQDIFIVMSEERFTMFQNLYHSHTFHEISSRKFDIVVIFVSLVERIFIADYASDQNLQIRRQISDILMTYRHHHCPLVTVSASNMALKDDPQVKYRRFFVHQLIDHNQVQVHR